MWQTVFWAGVYATIGVLALYLMLMLYIAKVMTGG